MTADLSMAQRGNREDLSGWLDALLDPTTPDTASLAITQAWRARWLTLLENVPDETGFDLPLQLSSGTAISPASAAGCLEDEVRTRRFLQAVDTAIRAMFERFPDQPIHLLEVGCGPFAPMSLPFAARYPGQVQLTLLDINPLSLEVAARLAGHLGVEDAIVAKIAGDATTLRLAERPHIIVCELIQRGLTDEPQVAATLNLAPQLRNGGRFIPARIEVRAGLFNAHTRFNGLAGHGALAGIEILGTVVTLDAADLPPPGQPLPIVQLSIPPDLDPNQQLCLLTRLALDEAHVTEDFEAAITLPEIIPCPPGLQQTGGRVSFHYETGPQPGPRMTRL